MFAGYFVKLGNVERFVIPAIVKDVVAKMVDDAMTKDPQDEYTVIVAWGTGPVRPDYFVDQTT